MESIEVNASTNQLVQHGGLDPAPDEQKYPQLDTGGSTLP